MAIRRPAKNVYKIFDKKEQVYLKGHRGKSSWTSPVWAIAAAQDFCRNEPKGYLEQFIEFHVFPIAEAIKLAYMNLVEEVATRNNK